MAIDVSNMRACIQDVTRASRVQGGPSFDEYARNFQKLIRDVTAAQAGLPLIYQQAVAVPLLNLLTNTIGEREFLAIFSMPDRRLTAQQRFFREIIPDIALAVLLNTQHFEGDAYRAIQEVVSDLYDGFLSEEDRVSRETGQRIKAPDLGVLPPLVKWGNPDMGPYTWPGDATASLRLGAGIVNLPPGFAVGGLFGLASLGHETGGHDILHADRGLIDELAKKVRAAVVRSFPAFLADYWKNCLDETASDVLGVLNMGPAAGIGLIGLLQGFFNGHLRTEGSADDPHPADILRGYIAASVVRRLSFGQAAAWATTIEQVTDRDLGSRTIDIGGITLTQNNAKRSSDVVAGVIADAKLKSLEGHSLREIQDWTDTDETIARGIGDGLRRGLPLPANFQGQKFFAAHAVAGATVEALKGGADVALIFSRVKEYLAKMHEGNTTWTRAPFVSRPHLSQRISFMGQTSPAAAASHRG